VSGVISGEQAPARGVARPGTHPLTVPRDRVPSRRRRAGWLTLPWSAREEATANQLMRFGRSRAALGGRQRRRAGRCADSGGRLAAKGAGLGLVRLGSPARPDDRPSRQGPDQRRAQATALGGGAVPWPYTPQASESRDAGHLMLPHRSRGRQRHGGVLPARQQSRGPGFSQGPQFGWGPEARPGGPRCADSCGPRTGPGGQVRYCHRGGRDVARWPGEPVRAAPAPVHPPGRFPAPPCLTAVEREPIRSLSRRSERKKIAEADYTDFINGLKIYEVEEGTGPELKEGDRVSPALPGLCVVRGAFVRLTRHYPRICPQIAP